MANDNGSLLSRVPEVTIYFWLIKVLATTVGETAADYLDTNLNMGLTGTSYLMASLLITVLVFQFRSPKYVAGIYWLAVVLLSIVGTLITDNLTDGYGVPLEATTVIFSCALAVTFIAWFAVERTLSIHTIYNTRRQAFYWLAILFTFALGTAAGDLASERFDLGYVVATVLFGGLIAGVVIARFGFKLNAITAFWIAYVLTRPLGASIGDLLSQPASGGGVGVGTTATSATFLLVILALVGYLARSKIDVVDSSDDASSAVQTALAPVSGKLGRTPPR